MPGKEVPASLMVHQNIENFSEFPLVVHLIVEAVELLWQYVLILGIVKNIQLAFQLTFESDLGIVMDIQLVAYQVTFQSVFQLAFLGDIGHHLETLVFDFFVNRLDHLAFFENH